MKKMNLLTLVLCILLTGFSTSIISQKDKKKDKKENIEEDKHPLDEIKITGLKWRNIGPAITSGRIADIAVNPSNPYEYYVATASGGVWKTNNSGLKYTPIFDSQGSYSIGCVTIDPNNHNIVGLAPERITISVVLPMEMVYTNRMMAESHGIIWD